MLTVVTNTRNERPEMLERCKVSVLAALPTGAKYEIIPIVSDFVENRYKSFLVDEYVAVVDDDDYIHPESIKLCMAAIKQSGAALAFTSEVVVDNAGRVLQPSSKSPKMYQNIAMFPREAHQLRVFKSSYLDERALNIARKYGLALDWIVTASAALSGGAIHVPIDGYYWVQHGKQHTCDLKSKYISSMTSLRKDIKDTYEIKSGRVPIFNVEEYYANNR